MKKKLLFLSVTLLSLLFLSAAVIDEDPFTALLKKLEDYNKRSVQEKVSLHLDKPYYIVGDDIWFKAYVIQTNDSRPTTISNILYVELINEGDSIKKQLRLPLQNGLTWGDFQLMDSLEEGNYRIRAYTQWMRNADPDFFFNKTIKVGKILPPGETSDAENKRRTRRAAKNNINTKADVQFFPEGGNLVQGLPFKIAVKCINSAGRGENITGTVFDNLGNEVVNFATTYAGMGTFILNPEPAKTYTANIKFADGSERKVALPKVEPAGYMLSVNNRDDSQLFLKIFLTPDMLDKGELKIIGLNNGNLHFAAKIPTDKPVANLVIPKGQLPSGIMQFTLFSPESLPVCERLAFINNTRDKISIDVQNLKETYKKREKVALDITTLHKAQPVIASLSVAVTNATSVLPDPENETNILTQLLLKSDLTGYIEKPNHYFLKDDVETRIELDNLILTQGWRRLLWADLLKDNIPPPKFMPEKSLDISGKVTIRGRKPAPNTRVSLYAMESGFFMTEARTDENGYFHFHNLTFDDNTKFVVQAYPDEGSKKNVKLVLDVVPDQQVSKNVNYGDIDPNVNATIMSYFEKGNEYYETQLQKNNLERGIQINEVRIRKAPKNLAPNSSNRNGAGRANDIITGDDLINAVSIPRYLQGRISGLYLRNNLPYLRRTVGGLQTDQETPMDVYVNGMQVGTDFLETIPPSDVESIEVLKSLSLTSVYRSSSGVLLITTKKTSKGLHYANTNPDITTYTPKGYNVNRVFYVPQYDTIIEDTEPDLRTTVYWDPRILSDEQGKTAVNYFNTDLPGTYRMVIEGMDANGNLARKVLTYKVE